MFRHPLRRSDRPLAVGLALAGLAAFVMTLVATSRGIGQYPDSAVYLGTARNLLDGRGLTTPFNLQFNPYSPADAVALYGRVPLTTFPPLYPLLLAAGGALGLGLTEVARVLDALLFAATVVLVGLVTHRITRSSTIAVVSAFAAASSVNLLVNHSLLMADPVVLVAALCGFLLLPRMLRAPTPGAIVAVGACAAVASLTRFAGVSLGATVVIATLLWADGSRRQRVRAALAVGAVAFGPLLLWIVGTRIASPRTAQLRPIGLHFPTDAQIETVLRVTASWLVGAGITESVTASIVVLAVMTVVVGALGLVLVSRHRQAAAAAADRVDEVAGGTGDDWSDSDRLLGTVAIFVVMSGAALWATATFFDASLPLEGRLLLPIQLGGILLVPGLLFRVVRGWSPVAVAVVVTAAFLVVCGWPWRTIARGFGTTTTVQLLADGWPETPESPLGQAVGALPDAALVASNYPATIYRSGGHDSVFIPPRRDDIAGRDNDDVDRQLAELGTILARSHGYVALYRDSSTAFVSAERLARAMNLRAITTFADGTLFRVEGAANP